MPGAINASFLNDEERAEAERGMLDIQPKTLHPGYRVFRFASLEYRDDWVTNGWWIGFSPFQAVNQLANWDDARLSVVARQALAVVIDPNKPHFNPMNVLLQARIEATLAAWTGRPKTQRVKKDQRYVGRLAPDPTVTQLYIPGLKTIPSALKLETYRSVSLPSTR